MLPRLMLVTDRRRTHGRDLVAVVRKAVSGGVRLIQLREGDLEDDELRALALRIRDAVPSDVQLVINGSIAVAEALGLGLHLAAAAAPLGGARRGTRLYGRSVHDEPELRAAVADGASYLVAGAVFPSAAKPSLAPAGLALIERICRQVVGLPVFGIGGISVARVPPVVHAGAYGVAVSGAILSASDPERVAEGLNLALTIAS
jgi:thiamine-phosphate pyrophosphorylase